MIIENAINIYTDGSSSPHPRKGGIGIRLVLSDSLGQQAIEDIQLPGYAGATNNQMELHACILGIKEALRRPAFNKFSHIVIHSDSLYVVDNYKTALFSWSQNKWRNRYGKPIDNADLWKKLIRIIRTSRKRFDIYWVKGHAKDEHNIAADKLARQSGNNAINPPLNRVRVRRKLSDKSVDPGCVPMLNQRISIRIITEQYLRLHKCYKYKYEVISKSNPYYGKLDFAFSEIMLNAGHYYSIRLNDNPKNPMIIKLFKELPKLKKSPDIG